MNIHAGGNGPDDPLRETISTAIRTHMKYTSEPLIQVCRKAVNIIMDLMTEPPLYVPRQPEGFTSLRSIDSAMIGKRDFAFKQHDPTKSNPERKREGSDDEDGNSSLETAKSDVVRLVAEKMKRTKHDFDNMLAEKGLATYGIAKDTTSKQMAKANTLSASIIKRFAVNPRKDLNIKILSEKVWKSIMNADHGHADAEEKAHEALLKSSKKAFTLNTDTFFTERYSGTPDAVLYQKGAIIDVAEFKTASGENDGIHQLKIYLMILGLESGKLVLEKEGEFLVKTVKISPEEKIDLEKRYATYRSYKDAINAN